MMIYNKLSKPLSNIDCYHSPRLESGLFLLIIFIEAAIFFYLINGRWLIGGHDGFQYFTLQYYFLNNVVNYGEIPQWMPFMTQGTVATWWYIVQGGILQNVLLLCGSLFKNVNFLTLFYAGIFVDELLLLVGVWLLAKRFFASPFTVFFITLSIMGSCIWMVQPWFNFHIYYAIPLILHFMHTFLESGKWRYLLLAGNLLAVQSIGNLPYFLPVISLVIFLYFLFYFLLNYKDIWQQIRILKFGWSFLVTSFLIIFSFIALYFVMNVGVDQIANYNFMRNLDGTTTLDGFLTYDGNLSMRKWIEIFLGISPFLNYTLYIGILSLPFILLGLIFNLSKNNLHFILIIVILLFFSMGTFISSFFYYCWPMMKFYRHLSLISPIIKIFLCFLAGFGFDAIFFNKLHWKHPLIINVSLAIMSIFMLGLSFLLYVLAHNYDFYMNLLLSMVPATHTMFKILFNEKIMTSLLSRTALFALTSAILFAVLSVINRKKCFIYLITFLLAIQCLDIYGFKFLEISLKATTLNDEMYKITDFQAMPYAKRRDISFWSNNPRAELLEILPLQYSAFTWSTHSFLFKDELGNQFRADHWLLPLDNYVRAYWGQSIHDLSIKPYGLFYYSRLEFPQGHPAALKISGVTEDKIQFFSQADVVSSDDIIASKITNANYKGDIIFLSLPEKNREVNFISSSNFSKDYLSSSMRLPIPYQVQRFDSNHLEVTANIHDLESAWILYSDVWHPFWRATVNGKATPVYKANLAYKAIKLEHGLNKVHFYFNSKMMSVFHFVFGLNALIWLGIIIWLAGKISFYPLYHR